MQMSCATLMTPIVENKSVLLRDIHLPAMMPNPDFIKQEEDEFSADSWDTASNDEIDDIMELASSLMSPDSSSYSSLLSPTGDDLMNRLLHDDVGNLKTIKTATKKSDIILDTTAETHAIKRERNRLAARRCRQKQKDRIDILEKEVLETECQNYKVETEIRKLQRQLQDLEEVLMNHECVMKAPTLLRQRYSQL